ncbi:cupin domain-containing protein [Rhodophyticola porphyridii]|uniref:cupin domain-containing protein n=1 Tax=Rhodophyticola porphyridii TaxID=1852017 RepID=UPI0035D00CD1
MLQSDAVAVVNRSNAPHDKWAEVCDGWRLLDGDDLSVIEECMPPGAAEVMHVHDKANQLFFVLDGTLTIEVDGRTDRLGPSDGLNVRPGQIHQARNEDAVSDVRFLVISSPTTRGDRKAV